MPSSDIYKVKDSPWAKKEAAPSKPQLRRHRSSRENFDQAVNKDVSGTHRRRQKNSGFRRFRHLMKKPEFSKKFWTIVLSVGAGILIVLIVWDWFFRYPSDELEVAAPVYELKVE